MEVDRPAVTRALMYLLSNEIEDARQAGRTRIRVTINEREDSVAFEVAHGGAPIPEDRRTALFEQFYTSKGANRLGLGLYEARVVAERHGGSLEYDVERGFVLTLPRDTPTCLSENGAGAVRD
jgi:signal transduction histidine kinase